jgi:hypothetical protein
LTPCVGERRFPARIPMPSFDLVRTGLHKVITTPVGDSFLPVRVPKDLARRVNAMFGEPICSKEEIERRRAGRAKLEELKKKPAGAGASAGAGARPSAPPSSPVSSGVQAPVMVYFEKDRNQRMLGRIEDALGAKSIKYTLLDIANDNVTRDFVLREARCKDDDLPVIFVAGTPIGGYNELVDWDVSGRLAKALTGR